VLRGMTEVGLALVIGAGALSDLMQYVSPFLFLISCASI
jgi:hypothetical protein